MKTTYLNLPGIKITTIIISLFLGSCNHLKVDNNDFKDLTFKKIKGDEFTVFRNSEQYNFAYVDKQNLSVASFCSGQWSDNGFQMDTKIPLPEVMNNTIQLPLKDTVVLVFEKKSQLNFKQDQFKRSLSGICPSTEAPDGNITGIWLIPDYNHNPCIPRAGCQGTFGDKLLSSILSAIERNHHRIASGSKWKCSVGDKPVYDTERLCRNRCPDPDKNCSRIGE